MTTLFDRLEKIAPLSETSFAPDLSIQVGLETKTDPAEYVWDGLKRGGDPAHPYIVFQYTLAGVGRYTAEAITHQVTPGLAFAAVVPSAHVYFLPPAAPSWTFFFLVIRHPYAVRRLSSTQATIGPLLTLAENDPLLARAVTLFEGIATALFRDSWALESALFDFVFEYERFAQRRLYPQAEREALLDSVRAHVRARLGHPVDVAELAALHSMSRSHFSHRFKAATGLPPARWIRQVQLEEATRRLLDSGHKLETIAQETGFANANHLCKVFRRHFHLSPGEFRRQMR
jgi:AraC-like DNA-binding protein